VKNLKKSIGIILLFCFIVLTGCNNNGQVSDNPINTKNVKLEVKKNITLNIVTTDKLLYDMVKSIVRHKHFVQYMFKDRNSEANFQFTNDSLDNISKKDLFFYIGAGFEPWANDFVNKLNKSRVGVINISRGAKINSYNKIVKYKDTVLKNNPYYLLNIDNYKTALMNIKNAIQDRDPKNRDLYEKNFQEALKNIGTYEKELNTLSNDLAEYTFIVPEDELSYFVQYNNLRTLNLNMDPNSLNLLQTSDGTKSDLETKLSNMKNVVILYNDEAVVTTNADLIKKYNIKTVNIKIYNGETKYEDVLNYDIQSLKDFYQSEVVKK
jgi:ABC-type Zn uptake system ZnuABC Zn-binding protein ZnuA